MSGAVDRRVPGLLGDWLQPATKTAANSAEPITHVRRCARSRRGRIAGA